jgi:hypothetical protein
MFRTSTIGFFMLLVAPWPAFPADAKSVSPVASESIERAAEHASDRAQEAAERAFDQGIPVEPGYTGQAPVDPTSLPIRSSLIDIPPGEPIVAPVPSR